jgi:hypothetical protein
VQVEVCAGEACVDEEKDAALLVTLNPDFTVMFPDPRPAPRLE